MIIMLIIGSLAIISLTLFLLGKFIKTPEKLRRIFSTDSISGFINGIFALISNVASAVILCTILAVQVNSNTTRLQYEARKSYLEELLKESNNASLAYVQVTAFNDKIIEIKEGANDPFVSWFYPQNFNDFEIIKIPLIDLEPSIPSESEN